MKVFEVNKNKKIKELDCLKIQTEIIFDILKNGVISFDTTDKLCKVLLDMKRVMNSYKVDAYEVYGGAIFEKASNELFVLEQIKLRTGFNVKVISNSEQRFINYEGVSALDEFHEMIGESAVIVDVGGASLQITLFVEGKIVTTQHLMLGTVSTAENLKKLESASNAAEQIYDVMYKELDVFRTMFLKDTKPKYMILLGDQMSLADSTIGGIDSKRRKKDEYIKALNKLKGMLIDEFLPELDYIPDNEGLIEPFIMLHTAIAAVLDPTYVVIPGISICDGASYHHCFAKKWLSSNHDFEQDVITAAWSISKRYGSYQPHLKALEKLSVQIFDTTKKYHGMGNRQRLLMRVITILHDCGKYISISEASDCSYTIIMSSEILGLTHKEREMIATVVAFNRQPLKSYNQVADTFTEDEYLILVKLLAILKVANALDRSHKQKLKNVSMSVKDNILNISIESASSMALERGMFSEKAEFFESVFALKPVLKEKRSIN